LTTHSNSKLPEIIQYPLWRDPEIIYEIKYGKNFNSIDTTYGVITGGVATPLPAMSGAVIFPSVKFPSVAFPAPPPSTYASTEGAPMVPHIRDIPNMVSITRTVLKLYIDFTLEMFPFFFLFIIIM
jgi:hypothetical protein